MVKNSFDSKKYLKKLWYILWKDDSLKGWILSIIFLLILIKLILFPTLNLITGTQYPLAIVESCSMYHKGNLFSNYNLWWDEHKGKYLKFNITKQEFKNFKFKNGFNKGDILFAVGVNPNKLKVGDIILFKVNKNDPIIHRIIKIKKINNKTYFSTIGDNNNGQWYFEKNISGNQIIGKASLKIAPYLGWGKLIFYDWRNPPDQRGACHQQ